MLDPCLSNGPGLRYFRRYIVVCRLEIRSSTSPPSFANPQRARRSFYLEPLVFRNRWTRPGAVLHGSIGQPFEISQRSRAGIGVEAAMKIHEEGSRAGRSCLEDK